MAALQLHIEYVSNYPISENTYVLRCEGSSACVLVDPFSFDELQSRSMLDGLSPEYILLTHEHYDHIGAVNELKRAYPNCKVVCSRNCDTCIVDSRKNMSAFFGFQLAVNERYDIPDGYIESVKPYECESADIGFCGDMLLRWSGHEFNLFETPGHSKGSICIVLDGTILFSGDTILKEDPICTKLPTGSRRDYWEKTVPLLMEMDLDTQVYPGHGDSFFLRDKYVNGEWQC